MARGDIDAAPYPGVMTVQLPVTLDRGSNVPLYRQLAQALTRGIDNGDLHVGQLVEPEVELAQRLSLSRPTVRRAIGQLVDAGLLIRRRGVGTVVATGGVRQDAELNSLYDDLVAERRSPRTVLLELDHGDVNAQAAVRLGLPRRTRLVRVKRLRLIGELPLAILENWLPSDSPAVPALTPDRLGREGLYSILRSVGLRPHSAFQRFGARNATGAERRLLRLTRADPLLTVSRRSYDRDGDVIECGDHCFRGDQYSIEVKVMEDA